MTESDPAPVGAPPTADELYIAFQPIVNFARRNVCGYEALLLCRTPTPRTPVEVINGAIATGGMGRMGRHLRALSVRGCPRTALFLNLHPSEFNEGWLVRPDDAM